jgi:hypothetical protein
MTEEEIEKVQTIVNSEIRHNHIVNPDIMPYKQAIKEGATALFDEKYGDEVRVLKIGSRSSAPSFAAARTFRQRGNRLLPGSFGIQYRRRHPPYRGRYRQGSRTVDKNNVINLKNEIQSIQAELDKERRRIVALPARTGETAGRCAAG